MSDYQKYVTNDRTTDFLSSALYVFISLLCMH